MQEQQQSRELSEPLAESLKSFPYSERPIGFTDFCQRLNDLIYPLVGRRVTRAELVRWLIKEKLILPDERGKRNRFGPPTEKGAQVGIVREVYVGRYGEIHVALLNERGQRFVVDEFASLLDYRRKRYEAAVAERVSVLSSEQRRALALALRKMAEKRAAEENTVFWKILRLKVIARICQTLPTNLEELEQRCVGLGKKKIEKYGREIIALVLAHTNDASESIMSEDATEESKTPVEKVHEPVSGVITARRNGFYYTVSGNDALLLHKYFGYKLYSDGTPKTGFPVRYAETVLKKLDALHIDYTVLDQKGATVASRSYEDNRYETVTDETCAPDSPKEKPLSFEEKMALHAEILKGLCEGVNTLTGEVVEGLDPTIRMHLSEMSDYFAENLSSRIVQPSVSGQKWTDEEDTALLDGYGKGKSIKELSEIHGRSTGAIRSRLLKLEARQSEETATMLTTPYGK